MFNIHQYNCTLTYMVYFIAYHMELGKYIVYNHKTLKLVYYSTSKTIAELTYP